jgi:hypothetical protein
VYLRSVVRFLGNPVRLVVELAQWDGVAVDGDAVWAVVLAGRAAFQAAKLSLEAAAAEMKANAVVEAAEVRIAANDKLHST